MAINPISNGPGPIHPPQAQRSGGNEAGGKDSGFGEMVRQAVDSVDGQQQAAGSALQDLMAGRSQDVVPVVTEMAKADLSFKLLMGVRNKVIEAYKQTVNMQI